MKRSKQCRVKVSGSRCENKALPGHHGTCGHHGKRSSSSSRRSKSLTFVHLDATIPALPEETTTPFVHVEFPYPKVRWEAREKAWVVSGLPTNQWELAAFVAEWLRHDGNLIEHICEHTKSKLVEWPDDFALSALSLIQRETSKYIGCHVVMSDVSFVAFMVPQESQEAKR